jgi:ketosteroid isomerase-like protein
MNLRFVVVTAVALLVLRCNAAAASYPQEMRPIMQPVNAVLAAMASHSDRQLAAAYTPDAVIIDTQAPYRWSGTNAADDWLSSLTTYGKLHYARFTAFGDPMQVEHGADRAYVTVLGSLSGLGSRSGLRQNVLLTFTLRDVGGAWKITSQSWTDVPPSLKLTRH